MSSNKQNIPQVPPLRRLAPAPPTYKRSPEEQNAKVRTKRQRLAYKACEACRKAKTKCDEVKPTCGRCQTLLRTCEYGADRIQQQIKMFQTEVDKYEAVLERIRTSSPPTLRRTMNILRTGMSVEDVLVFLRRDDNPILPVREITPERATSPLTLLTNAQLEEEGQTVPKQMELGIIDDRPYFDLSHLKDVTSVTDDNELISHLLSSLVTWDNPGINFLDAEVFMEGLINNDPQFCSPLLTNTALGMACHFSTRVPVRADPHNPNTLEYRFTQEAMRLWHEVSDQPTLTTIQAGFILSELVSINGMDHLGWMLFQQSHRLLEKFLEEREKLKVTKGKEKGLGLSYEDTRREEMMDSATSVIVWGAFRISCIYSLIYKNRPLMKIPTVPFNCDVSDLQDIGDVAEGSKEKRYKARMPIMWRPYPFTQPTEPDRSREGIQAFSEICIIIHIMSELITTDAKTVHPLTIAEKTQLFDKVVTWRDNLPEGLKIGQSCAPFISVAHVTYCWLLIDLCAAPLDPNIDMESTEAKEFLELTGAYFMEAQDVLYTTLGRFEKRFSIIIIPEPLLIGFVIASKLAMEALTAFKKKSEALEKAPPPALVPEKSDVSNASSATPLTSSDRPNVGSRVPSSESNATTSSTEEVQRADLIEIPEDMVKHEKTIDWLCTISDQFLTVKMQARALQISAAKANLKLGVKTQANLNRLFGVGEARFAKWIEELTKLIGTRLTLTMSFQEDNAGDVLKELENLKI